MKLVLLPTLILLTLKKSRIEKCRKPTSVTNRKKAKMVPTIPLIRTCSWSLMRGVAMMSATSSRKTRRLKTK